jgi:hypothetical protein
MICSLHHSEVRKRLTDSTKHLIPNVLWSYWESPHKTLPPIVQTCLRSWNEIGGFTQVNLLRPSDLETYLAPFDLPLRFADLPPVKKANAIRLALLAKYGGFWADAGVLVTAPVLEWVQPKASKMGFFVFQDVDKSRALDTWFIGSHKDSVFLKEWHERYNAFFSMRKIHDAHSLAKTPCTLATHGIVAINKMLGRSIPRTATWARFPLSRMPMYPYFIMHYIANSMLSDANLLEEFASIQKVKASLALELRNSIDRGTLSTEVAINIAEKVPIHKLNTYREYSSIELDILQGLVSR